MNNNAGKHKLYEQRHSKIEELEKKFPQATSIQLFCKINEYSIALESWCGDIRKGTSKAYHIEATAYNAFNDNILITMNILDIPNTKWTTEALNYLILSGNIVVIRSDNYMIDGDSFSLINTDIVKILDKEFDYLFNPCWEALG